jgi:hypothetical protein
MTNYKLVHSFPSGVKVVGMIQYKDRVLLATEDALYELIDDQLEPVTIKWLENAPVDPPKYDQHGDNIEETKV